MGDWWDDPAPQTVEAEERLAIRSEAPVRPGTEAQHQRQVSGHLTGSGTPLWTMQTQDPERGLVCLCADEPHRGAVQARADRESRLIETWTLAEVAAVLGSHLSVAKIKAVWPGAAVTAARSTGLPERMTGSTKLPADDIPFGAWGAGEKPEGWDE